MKSILALLLVLFVTSCGSSEFLDGSEKEIAGYWELVAFDFPEGHQDLPISLFDEISPDCLYGSSWNFIIENHTGSYEPTGPECRENPQFFTWSLVGETAVELVIQPTDAAFASLPGIGTYRFDLVRLEENQMVLAESVIKEGETFTIQMELKKRE